MTNPEFSNEFDVLYNNIASNQAPGLNEYEKSVFLTKAQNEIVKNYFTEIKGGNKYEQGFEGSQKRFVDFSKLVTIKNNCPIPFDSYSAEISYDEEDYSGNTASFSGRIYYTKTFNGINDSVATTGLPTSIAIAVSDSTNGLSSVSDNTLRIAISSKDTWDDVDKFTTYVNDTVLGNVDFKVVIDSVNIQSEFDKSYTVIDSKFEMVQEIKFSSNSILIDYPKDFFLYISGECSFEDTSTGLTVTRQQLPIDFKEYVRIMSKPYKNGLKRQVLSISTNPSYSIGECSIIIDGITYSEIPSTEVNSAIELILPYNSVFKQYRLRYVRYPQPIILEDLSEAGLSIQGISTASECELNEEVHPEILQRAVELAKMAYIADIKDVNTIVAMGQRSE